MRNRLALFGLSGLCVTIALFILGCAGAVSERGTGGQSVMSEEEFVASIKRVIDYEVTEKDALDDIESVRGRVVKWSGNITQIWVDKIHVLGHGEEEHSNFFELLLDHPLPQETRIGDRTQTLIVGDPIYVVGSIENVQTVVARSINIDRMFGIPPNIGGLSRGEIGPSYNVTAPILRGYIISRENDRNFENPVWVAKKM